MFVQLCGELLQKLGVLLVEVLRFRGVLLVGPGAAHAATRDVTGEVSERDAEVAGAADESEVVHGDGLASKMDQGEVVLS